MQQPTQQPWSSWQRWVNSRHKLMERLHNQFARVPLHDTHTLHWSVPQHVIYVPNHIRYESIPFQGGRKHTWNFLFPPTLPPSWLKALESEISDIQPTLPPPPRPRVRTPVSTLQWRDAATATVLAVGVLLFVLLLAVRIIDKYYDLRFCKVFGANRRRNRRAEWQRPPALAALDQQVLTVNTTDPFPRDQPGLPADTLSVDLPPPYSECAPTSTVPLHQEDPPPPYSSCLVSFRNSKDGTPTVHFYDSQRKKLFANTTNNNSGATLTGENNAGEASILEEASSNLSLERTSEERNVTSSLVYENERIGRAVERNEEPDLHINLNSDSVIRTRNEDENKSLTGRQVVV